MPPNYPCAGSKLSPRDRAERIHEGHLPLVLRRTYRTLDPMVRPCGVGWRHRYEPCVRAVSADRALLITPENLRPRFDLVPVPRLLLTPLTFSENNRDNRATLLIQMRETEDDGRYPE